jgi:hypothetical protein
MMGQNQASTTESNASTAAVPRYGNLTNPKVRV